MSQLRKQLSKMLPKLSQEANKLRDPEARSRWMKIKKITQSTKSIAKACAFYGWSEDAFNKWGKRLIKGRSTKALFSKSRKPYRSPNQTARRKEKKVIQIRRADPSQGPERISDDLKRLFKMTVPVSTVHAILKRSGLITQVMAARLTKKHLRRYRRPLPGYLQMDFKYVPYPVDGKQYYQLSCVDHHSSWRLIRIYSDKSTKSVLHFLNELINQCPFPIFEIQTDNDTAFTDKFSSKVGVTGMHDMDVWCDLNKINHRLIPVGVKELNGKVENTHKQDDREFYAKGPFKNLEQIQKNSMGYNERWNYLRRTKALGFKSPVETLEQAFVKAIAFTQYFLTDKNKALYKMDKYGNSYLETNEKKVQIKTIKTSKPSIVDRYLSYHEWEEGKKKLPAILAYPTMSQSFSEPKSSLRSTPRDFPLS